MSLSSTTAAPARIASSRFSSSAVVSTGSEQDEPEDDARVPCRDRPAAVHDLIGPAAERELREPGDREPEPGADEELRRDRPAPAGARHERQRGQAAREQDHAARDALHAPSAAAGDDRRDRGERHDRHDDAGRRRGHPPPVDEEEHDEEERGDEPARDEEQRGVGGDRRTSRRERATGRTSTPRTASNSTSASGTCARKIDSQPSSCVRIPPAAGPSAAPSTPAATQVRSAASSLPFACERRSSAGGDEQRGAERLDAPGSDEHLERGREPAGERRHGEDDDTRDESLARPPPRDIRGRHGDDARARG